MTHDRPITADFHVFAEVLGYSFRSRDRASGHRIITQLKPNKDAALSPCTVDNGIVGTVAGLAPIYAALVGLFRDSITPSGATMTAVVVTLFSYFNFLMRLPPARMSQCSTGWMSWTSFTMS